MAIFGRMTLEMAEKYTRGANQKKPARSAMQRLVPLEQTEQSQVTGGQAGTFSQKIQKNQRRILAMVPVEGIEPPLLAEHDFESCASTSSATRA
jgi:hypothetical protein